MPFPLVAVLIATAISVGFTILGQLLMPKNKAKAATIDEIQFPTATEDRPKPVFVGTIRHRSANAIWYGDYGTRAIKKSAGLFSTQTVGYKYFVGIQLAFGWGQVDAFRKIWLNDKVAWEGTETDGEVTIDKPELFGGNDVGGSGGFVAKAIFYDGNGTQTANSYVTSHAGASPAYKDDAMIVFRGTNLSVLAPNGAYIGNTPTFPEINVEMSRYPNQLAVTSGKHIIDTYDANPVCALFEFLTRGETEFGWGLNASQFNLTNWRAAAEQVHSEGLGISRIFDNEAECESVATEYLHLIDAVINTNMQTGLLEIVLARPDYDPDTILHLTDDDFAEIEFTRGSWIDTFNEVKMTYTDRTQEYEPIPIAAQDLANASGQVEVRSQTIEIKGVSNPTTANNVIWRELRPVSLPLSRLDGKINRKGYQLYGGAVFKWSSEKHGVESMIFRVADVSDGTLQDGRMTVKCVQDVFALGDTAYGEPTDSGWEPIDTDAANITEERIIEQPYFFHETENHRVMTVAAPANGAQQSYDLRTKLSTETTYIERLTAIGFTPLGTLESDYTSVAYETGGLLVVTPVSGMDDLPAAVTPDEIAVGQGLILINNEILAYESYTIDIDGNYVFDNVWGGLLDTLLAEHTTGDDVWFISMDIGIDPTNYDALATVNAKLLSNAPSGQVAEGSATTLTL